MPKGFLSITQRSQRNYWIPTRQAARNSSFYFLTWNKTTFLIYKVENCKRNLCLYYDRNHRTATSPSLFAYSLLEREPWLKCRPIKKYNLKKVESLYQHIIFGNDICLWKTIGFFNRQVSLPTFSWIWACLPWKETRAK